MAQRAFLTATLLGAIAHADATEQAVHLSWTAPTQCPSNSAVMNDVQRILGGTTSHHATARADVTALGPERWSVHIVTDVDGAAGERTIEANSCEALASATALILALTVDPTRARAAAAPSRSPPAPPPPLGRAPESVHVLVAASGVGELGTLPHAGVAGELAVGVLFGPIRGELSAADWFTQDATASSGEGTHIHLLEGAFRGCFRGRFGDRVELDPCAGVGLVFASSNGFGESQTFARSSTWSTLHGDLLASWALVGPLALRASLGFGIPLARPPFVLLDPQGELTLHQAFIVTGRATLGVEAHFP